MSKRRANGEGCWSHRTRRMPSGTVIKEWAFFVSLGIDQETGKRVRRGFYGKTKAEVKLKYEKVREKHGGTVKRSDPQTVEAYLTKWFDEVERFKSGPTQRFYEGRIRRFAFPLIGHLKLEEIGNQDIAKMYRRLERDGVSADNVQKLHRALRRAFNVAIGKGFIRANPCAHVERRPHRPAKRLSLNAEQVGTFFKAIDGHRLEAMFRLGILATMRPGELYALRWEDIDRKNRLVDIRHNLEELRVRKLVPAKADSARKVPIEAGTAAALERHHAAMKAEGHGSEFVFVTERGEWLPSKDANRTLKAICADAELPAISMYGLRHSGVSLFGEAGVGIRVISDLAGHSNSAITLDVYSHATSNMHKDAVERAAELVKKRPA